jgi:hypothetical protein
MSKKIRYATGRNGEYAELPLNSTTLIMPDGAEFVIRYDCISKGLEVIKSWASSDGDSMMILPGTANKVLIK